MTNNQNNSKPFDTDREAGAASQANREAAAAKQGAAASARSTQLTKQGAAAAEQGTQEKHLLYSRGF